MRKVREGEVKVGLGSGTLLLDADAARGLVNPRRVHLSYLPLRAPGIPLLPPRL